MDREEAKTHLVAMKAKFEMLLSMRGLEVSDVFDVAIEALSTEPCEDAINRQAAIKAMDDMEQEDIERYGCSIPEGFDGKRAIEALKKLPSVTPNQKMGRWEYTGTYDEDGMLECSVCKREVDESCYHYKFCPICGAKMEGSEDTNGK